MLTADNIMQINIEGNVKLLGITADNKLSFEPHLSKIYEKVSQKLNAFARIPTYISQEKLKMIMRAFLTSQFSYCSLLWMCDSSILIK